MTLTDNFLDFWFSFKLGKQRVREDICYVSVEEKSSTEIAIEKIPEKNNKCVRLIVVSDTHGRHSALSKTLNSVENADILIHCGDIMM